MTFAEKLQKALNKSGMTRAELADKAGISRPMITNYLKGGYKAKQNNIFKLARALNISENDLIEDEYVNNNCNDTPAYYLDPETAEIAEQLHKRKDMRMLFHAAKSSTPEDVKMVTDMLERFKNS